MDSNADPAAAWAAVYLENRRALHTYALALTGSQPEAHDLLQDVLVRLVRQRRHVEHARAFLLRCLRNAAVDRRRARQLDSIELAMETAFLDGATAAVEVREAVEQVRQALTALPDAQREVVVLKVYAALTFQEIAEVLERPMGTVTSHYARALERLRAVLPKELCDG